MGVARYFHADIPVRGIVEHLKPDGHIDFILLLLTHSYLNSLRLQHHFDGGIRLVLNGESFRGLIEIKGV